MGHAKEIMLRDESRGWTEPPDKYVCPDHIENDYLATLVAGRARERACDYCERQEQDPIACHISILVQTIAGVIGSYWDDAENLVPDDEDCAWPVSNTFDVLSDDFRSCFDDSGLADDLFNCFIDRTLAKNSVLSLTTEEMLGLGWQRFTEVVTHERRYLFQSRPTSAWHKDRWLDSGVPPWEMLDQLAEAVASCELVHALDSGSQWYRARPHRKDQIFTSANELGTPPVASAIYANRMSPAGIPMFYGALDEQIAVAEVWQPRRPVTTGRFETARALNVLDLTKLPTMPSLLEVARRHQREVMLFVHAFVKDLSKPITKDGREHIEYVPTQIVTEYFRHVFDSPSLDGLLYPSAQLNGGVACVLFVENDGCIDIAEGWRTEPKAVLGLDPASVRTYTSPSQFLRRRRA